MVTRINVNEHRQVNFAHPLLAEIESGNWNSVIDQIAKNPQAINGIYPAALVRAVGVIRFSDHPEATAVYKFLLESLAPGKIIDLDSPSHMLYDEHWDRTQIFLETDHLYKAPMVCLTTLYRELKEKNVAVPFRLQQIIELNQPHPKKPSHCCEIL